MNTLFRFTACAMALGVTLLQGCAPVRSEVPGSLTSSSWSSPSPALATAGMRCQPQTTWRLYFGLHTPIGTVQAQQWQDFVDAAVAPRLPSGFTLMAAQGQWRGADGRTQSEESRVLEVVGGADLVWRQTVAEIAGLYKTRFQQEAVLVTESPTRSCL